MAVLAIEWSRGIEDAWSDIAMLVPKFVGFMLILLIGYFVVKAIAKVADGILERVGFDRAVERGGVARALSATNYDASDIVSKVIFYALFLLVLQMAFGVFGTNPISDLIEGVIAYPPKVIAAILIVVVTAAIGAAAKELIEATLGGLSYGQALAKAASVAILVVGVFAALNQLQIAPQIVTGLFYALLAIVAGSAIIAIGGGGVQPMRERWERALFRYDEEAPRLRAAAQGAHDRVQTPAQRRTDPLRAQRDSSGAGTISSTDRSVRDR